MAQEPHYIDLAEFAANPIKVLEEVRDRNQPVLIERDGETYRVEKAPPEDPWKDYDPEKVRLALRASRGALTGVAIDELLQELEEQRAQGPGRSQ